MGTSRVLGTNHAARRLYARCGSVVEGVQRGQFYLGGRYVDDVLLALDVAQPATNLAPPNDPVRS
jgi:RimJ/RimL family protein N-acetyltransferase